MSNQTTTVVVAIPVLLLGGTEMQTLQQVRVLVNGGYRVTVCCFYQHDEAMRTEMEKAGATVVLLGMDPAAGLLRLLGWLVRFLRRERPDIVHVQYMAPGFIPVLAARLAGIRTIFATVHQPGTPYGQKATLLLRTAARLCTAFFCNSQAVERSWFGHAALFDPHSPTCRRHWTIHNAVDADRIASLAAAADVPDLRSGLGLGTGPVIGCVGRLRHEKGQMVLLEAMPAVLQGFPEAVLLMVGDGPDRETLKEQADVLGIGCNVVWAGRRDADEVFRLMGAMDVAVVPSFFEGFGLVAAEAMAAGLPVVASDVDGLAEVVADGETGLLVPAADSAGLGTALVRLLGDPQLAKHYGRSGLARVRDHFSLETYRANILEAYRQWT